MTPPVKPCPKCGQPMAPDFRAGVWVCPAPACPNLPLAPDAEQRVRNAPTLPGFGP